MVNRLIRLLPYLPVAIGGVLLVEAVWYATSAGGGYAAGTLTGFSLAFGAGYLVAGGFLVAGARLQSSHRAIGWAAIVVGVSLLAGIVFLSPWTAFLTDRSDVREIFGPFSLATSLGDLGILIVAPLLLIVAAIVDARHRTVRKPPQPT